MREILFRGKRTDTKEWIEGVAFPHDNNKVTMLSQHPMDGSLVGKEVDPKTVGQFTGFIDKNGTKIFEDDICHFYDQGGWGINHICAIKINRNCLWYLKNVDNVEIIGNIYDNPALSGGADGVRCTPIKKIKFIGDTVMMPIADFNKLNAENKNNGLLKDSENE